MGLGNGGYYLSVGEAYKRYRVGWVNMDSMGIFGGSSPTHVDTVQ